MHTLQAIADAAHMMERHPEEFSVSNYLSPGTLPGMTGGALLHVSSRPENVGGLEQRSMHTFRITEEGPEHRGVFIQRPGTDRPWENVMVRDVVTERAAGLNITRRGGEWVHEGEGGERTLAPPAAWQGGRWSRGYPRRGFP